MARFPPVALHTGSSKQELPHLHRKCRDVPRGAAAALPATTLAGDFEIAVTSERLVMARDSKNPYGPVLCFDKTEWHSFSTNIKSGSYDLVRVR
jgi:hypothetical protein